MLFFRFYHLQDMSLRELSSYQHLHDYLWYILCESGYQNTEPFHCSEGIRRS